MRPWRGKGCHAVSRRSRPNTEKLALAHVFISSRRNGARCGFAILLNKTREPFRRMLA
jgi:hypothetical protein